MARLSKSHRRWVETMAKKIVLNCVRNTQLEDLHAGITPSSKTGDYTDVKVVSPYGEIPWNNLSRISDDEMKALMIEIVNNVYTVLWCLESKRDILLRAAPQEWYSAKLNRKLMLTPEMVNQMIEDFKASSQESQ